MTTSWVPEDLDDDPSREADWRMAVRGVPLADFEDENGHLSTDTDDMEASDG